MSGYQRLRQPKRFKWQMHELAAELRRRETQSEEQLWEALRNRQLDGRKFRRQVPLGAYVMDFYCADEKLAIEIDGEIHTTQQERDRLRQEGIEELNIRFLRFTVAQVESNLNEVLAAIKQTFTR